MHKFKIFLAYVKSSPYICSIMNKQFKTTAEVAQTLGWDKEPCQGPIIGEQLLKKLNSETLEILQDPEETVEEVELQFLTAIAPILAFNVIGNGRSDYSTNYKQSEAEIKKSFEILAEEVEELRTAMFSQDKVEILDAVVDIIVVAVGIAMKEGVIGALPKAYAMICHNNLLKFKFDEEAKRLYADVKNGKIQKPEGFVGVDLKVLNTDGGFDAEAAHIREQKNQAGTLEGEESNG